MAAATFEKFFSKDQPKRHNLIYVEITELGQVTWRNVCPKDVTLRLKSRTWGFKHRSRSVGDGKKSPVEFFKIGARLRRFCRFRPGTIAVLDGSDEWQMAALLKIIRRLIRWGILVQPEGVEWPRFAPKSSEDEKISDSVLDGQASLV